MKGLLIFICVALLGCCIGLAHFTAQTEMHAARWTERMVALEHVESLNMDLVRAMEYSELSVDAVRMLAHENVIMCQRDAKMVEVVAVFEEENRALKNSLSEAVTRLEEQLEQINDLFGENDDLYWEIDTMQNTILLMLDEKESLQKQISLLEYTVEMLRSGVMPPGMYPDPEDLDALVVPALPDGGPE